MPAPTTPMPLELLVDEYRRHGRSSIDPWIPATQLGLLPDLSFLRDGLDRVRGCIARAGDELDYCLRIVPGSCLDAGPLAAEVTSLITWIDAQGWTPVDPRMLPMERPSVAAQHPLAGYCLSVSYLWPLMFYALPPTGTIADVDSNAFERLMDVFAMHVIAAQSTISSAHYHRFCRDWWDADVVPAHQPFPERHLGSRIAAASRVIRRLTAPESSTLFEALAGGTDRRRYHLRLQELRKRDFSEQDQLAIGTLSRLLEDVVPGWSRPDDWCSRPHRPSSGERPRENRRTYQDGYVRVSESSCVSMVEATDAGLVIESIVPRPLDLAERTTELINEQLEALGAGRDDDDATTLVGTLSREAALALAVDELDGQEWLPVDEAIADGGIEFVNLDESVLPDTHSRPTHGTVAGNNSRWAQDHRRRFHFAHRLSPSRLDLSTARNLLGAMMHVPTDSPDGPALVCLHASIAVGRPFREACSLLVLMEAPERIAADDRIRYVVATRQWLLPAVAPAWSTTLITTSERVRADTLVLDDQTGFADLLQRFCIDKGGQPVRRLTEMRAASILQWVARHLEGLDQPMSACAGFLFHQLLFRNGGDVGVARLITDHVHSHSQAVAHYSHYSAEDLRAAYRRAWCTGTLVATGPEVEPSADSGLPNAGGARRVPTVESVRNLLRTLRERMFDLDHRQKHLQRHNLYSAYTWAGCVLGLAMRPVVRPYIHELASSTGRLRVVTFVDKARTAYHRRINVVPPALDEHLYRYSRHLNECDRMQPMAATSFRFLDESNGCFEAFRPRHFSALCADFFDLELYSLRRFVRTELARDANITGEDIDVLMGHWFDRLSPHDPLSCYPMGRQHGVVRGAVSRMLKGVGFVPLWVDQVRT